MMNSNQQACDLEAWQVQGKLEKHSSSFSWWDHSKNMYQYQQAGEGITKWHKALGDKEASRREEKTQTELKNTTVPTW